MIGSLEGVVRGIVRGIIVIDAGLPGQGGVGYGVSVTPGTLAKAKEGERLFLWTHLAVRENAHDLYGFPTKEELQWFELLLTVSGIGPRSALAILSGVDITTLERAIARGDASALEHAYGIGKKTAQKIVLELREKVGAIESAETGVDADVIEALVGLGYSSREARDAMKALPDGISGAEARIREAIRIASQGR